MMFENYGRSTYKYEIKVQEVKQEHVVCRIIERYNILEISNAHAKCNESTSRCYRHQNSSDSQDDVQFEYFKSNWCKK